MKMVFDFLASPFRFMYHLYADGFKNMSKMSRTLWLVAILKLIIMFGLLKVFFFKKHLNQFKTEEEKIEHISKELTNQNK